MNGKILINDYNLMKMGILSGFKMKWMQIFFNFFWAKNKKILWSPNWFWSSNFESGKSWSNLPLI